MGEVAKDQHLPQEKRPLEKVSLEASGGAGTGQGSDRCEIAHTRQA